MDQGIQYHVNQRIIFFRSLFGQSRVRRLTDKCLTFKYPSCYYIIDDDRKNKIN
jgi:hypothetical protein